MLNFVLYRTEYLSNIVKVPKRNVSKYIQNDLAEEIFASLQLIPLAGCKWIWKGTNVCQSFRENAKDIET